MLPDDGNMKMLYSFIRQQQSYLSMIYLIKCLHKSVYYYWNKLTKI